MPFATSHFIFVSILLINLVMIAFLLLVIKGNRNFYANLLLSLFCLNYAVIELRDLLISRSVLDHYPILIEADTLLLLTLGPFFYLYVIAMTRIRFRFQFSYLLHLLPVIIYVIYLIPFKLQPTAIQLLKYHEWQNYRQSTPLMMIYFSKSVILIYLVMAYRLIAKHQLIIKDLLGNIDGKNLQWAKSFIMGLTGVFIFWICNNEGWLPRALYFDVVQILFTYWLGYVAINQHAVFTNVNESASLLPLSQETKIRYRNSLMSDEVRQDLINKVSKYAIDCRPHLNQELTLTMLAEELQLSPAKLSQVLNDGFGENFYTFINRHRVEEAKMLLQDPKFSHYSILGIAFESGFNSKSTFNKVFREVTSLPPSAFRNYP